MTCKRGLAGLRGEPTGVMLRIPQSGGVHGCCCIALQVAAAVQVEVEVGDEVTRRPASNFLVMGNDSKSSESLPLLLLKLLLMLLRLTALLGLCSPCLSEEGAEWRTSLPKREGNSSTGEQGSSDTARRHELGTLEERI